MVITMNGVAIADETALGAILIACLVITLISKEVLGHYKETPRLPLLYQALKLLWIPLTLASILVFGEQLIRLGIL